MTERRLKSGNISETYTRGTGISVLRQKQKRRNYEGLPVRLCDAEHKQVQ